MTATAERNWGKLELIIPEAASPAANTARRGKRMEGLSKDEPPPFSGALNKGDSRPSLWFAINLESMANQLPLKQIGLFTLKVQTITEKI